ncbi:MAG TPA: cupin domain-containing protein [Candidatus Bariatricus faecipullorum]|nr:cupin domain-containing protein [Candidatus Bariatricus faecipullorum]
MSQRTPVGLQIKALRTGNNMTLKQLSEQTGLSIGFLSQVERGMSSIAVDSLEKIAGVLEVPLATFFSGSPSENSDPVMHSFELQGVPVSDQIFQYALARDEKSFSILPRIFALMPFANFDVEELEMYSHTGEEFIYVLEGIVTLVVNSRQHTLYPGDSILIHSSEPHNWMNSTNKVARLLCINTPNPFLHPEPGHIMPQKRNEKD